MTSEKYDAPGAGAESLPAADEWGGGCGPNCFTLDGDGFTCARVLDEPEVWRVELLMHDTFLPSVNAFVVLDGGEALVVDAGTPDPMNDTRLMRALLGLGVDPARTTLFCTHAHIDHVGLARELAEAGARVLVPEGVLADMRRFAVEAWRDEMAARLAAEGAPAAEAAELADVIWDHVVNFERERVAFETVAAGSPVGCGRWSFEVVPAPGHTQGQCVLWEPRSRTAFLGDAVLFLCSTCIGFWGEGEDPLGAQLKTLRRLAGMGIEHAFMGHGLQEGDVSERCLANAAHHERRSARALAAIEAEPGRTGFELVGELGWRAPFDHWAQTPALTRWFLVSESVAHLDHLVATGAARRERGADGVSRYFPS
ncbi:MBL fold metallo-hydrolase [Olsenella sp. An188]|uniref:MBL fold metallo-hydrolase n=1 Tax=Olsenella sp. An188 TaxID=1965579 RepID=UPI000B3B0357|nr:MBL fold metallo-hydrolase [Olsenella sp. An188]OUP39780.1 hypothetical protein B5F23_02035 [Olsenella sp. An188]